MRLTDYEAQKKTDFPTELLSFEQTVNLIKSIATRNGPRMY